MVVPPKPSKSPSTKQFSRSAPSQSWSMPSMGISGAPGNVVASASSQSVPATTGNETASSPNPSSSASLMQFSGASTSAAPKKVTAEPSSQSVPAVTPVGGVRSP